MKDKIEELKDKIKVLASLGFTGQQQYDYLMQMLQDKKQETLKQVEKMKFCIFCKASPELCICNNPEPYKFVVWAYPLKQKLGEIK